MCATNVIRTCCHCFYPFNAGGLHPHVEFDVAQSVVWPPFIDGINLELLCKASVKNGDEIVAIEWTGVGAHKSLWVQQSDITKRNNHVERRVMLKPWLESHAGIYTCHLAIKDKQASIYIMYKAIEVKGKHCVLVTYI